MNQISVLIVDDELLAREYLRSLVESQPDLLLIGECENGQEAISAIKKLAPDIVFLDVQMPARSGFEVIEAITIAAMPAVVFVTAYDRFALKAFEAHALDYLLKPFDEDRFLKTLERLRSDLRVRKTNEALTKSLSALLAERASDSAKRAQDIRHSATFLTQIPIKSAVGSYLLQSNEIEWIAAEDYYVSIHARGKTHLLRESLHWMSERLDPHCFYQTHRSAIVNIQRIKELLAQGNGDFVIVMSDGSRAPLSRRRRRDLEKLLGRAI